MFTQNNGLNQYGVWGKSVVNVIIVGCIVLMSTWSVAQEVEYFGIYSDEHFNPVLEFDTNINPFPSVNTYV